MAVFEVIYRENPRDPVVRQEVKGHAEALVRRDFESRGCTVLAIIARKQSGARTFLKKLLTGKGLSLRFGVSTSELAMLCEVLNALYSSGVPLLQGVQMSMDETGNPWLRKRLGVVLDRLREGDDIYVAMSNPQCRKAFPSLMRETIRTGEKNGRLDLSLRRLAELFDRATKTKREMISAILYPAFTFLVFIVVATVIAIKVPDALENILGAEKVDMMLSSFPPAIQALFFLRRNPAWLVMPPVTIAGIAFLWGVGKRYHPTRVALTQVERKLPLIGSVLYQFALVRFLDLLAANNETGIEVPESLNLIRGSVNDVLIEDSLVRMRERILTAGSSLSEAMSDDAERTIFPGLARQMIRAGEESGRLSEMLLPIISFYGEQARATLSRTLDMLTPTMIVLLGGLIGPVVMGVYQVLIQIQDAAVGSY